MIIDFVDFAMTQLHFMILKYVHLTKHGTHTNLHILNILNRLKYSLWEPRIRHVSNLKIKRVFCFKWAQATLKPVKSRQNMATTSLSYYCTVRLVC